MTQAISEKNQASVPVWRRHSDPPGLWIALVTTSVILHLLAIWFIRSSGGNLSWQKNSTSVIPIQFVEVSPVKKTTKPVSRSQQKTSSSKPSTQQNSSVTPTQKRQTSDAIALTESNKKQSTTKTRKVQPSPRQSQPASPSTRKQTFTTQPKVKKSIKPENQTSPQPKQESTSTTQQNPTKPVPSPSIPPQNTPQPVPSPSIPLNQSDTNKPWEGKREEIKLGEGKKLPETNPSPSNPPSSSDRQQGGLVLRVNPLSRNDVIALMASQKLRLNPPPDNMAVYQGSPNDTVDINIVSNYPGIKAANILASLVIDQNGKFEDAFILQISPEELANQKATYQNFLNSHFRTQKFLPGRNNNGTKPDASNLILNITIERQQQPDLPGSMLENQ